MVEYPRLSMGPNDRQIRLLTMVTAPQALAPRVESEVRPQFPIA
jgi:hypothetical protein